MIIMAKKKKHVHTEKERLFQEEAARKRADGAIGYSVSGGLAVLAGFYRRSGKTERALKI